MTPESCSKKGIRFAAAGVILTFGVLPVLRFFPATQHLDFLQGIITGMGLTFSVAGIVLIGLARRKR